METDRVTRNERPVLLLLCILFLTTRLPGLLTLPLFNDEAIYLYRAQQFPAQLEFTVHDGKLIHELLLAALARLPWDPLLTGRILSVLCGWLTVVGLWLSGRIIGDRTAGLFAGLLYILSPLAIIHDRLAIPDAMLGSIAGFLLAASLRLTLLPQPNRWHAAGVGALGALATLVKLPGLFLFALPALIIVTSAATPERRHQQWALLRTVLIMTLLAPASFAPFNYGGAENHKVGVFNLALQIERLTDNVRQIGEWLALTLPLPTLALIGLGLSQRPTRRLILTLVAAACVFCMALATIGSVLYPRYILPAWPLLLVVAGVGLSRLCHLPVALRGAGIAIALINAIWGSFFAIQYAQNPAQAPLTTADRHQYIETWTAGYHLDEITLLLHTEAEQKGDIALLSPLQPRLIHIGPKVYLNGDPRISFVDVDVASDNARQLINEITTQRTVYVTLDAEEVVAFDIERRFPELKIIREWRNPHSDMAFYLYVWSP
ncbi:ArnT family glycosyltransferase [Roseiflexus castenholzii]|uniref:ArnT family glycosyltransferase n=1 Tax=Roseiflexus castenholzii TaxID=120962 RepID=UPI0002D83E0C|nr:glycosyltransferase family 39 protein [Roseiflexus castenholzii]